MSCCVISLTQDFHIVLFMAVMIFFMWVFSVLSLTHDTHAITHLWLACRCRPFFLFSFFTSFLASCRMEEMLLSGDRGMSMLLVSGTADIGLSDARDGVRTERLIWLQIASESESLALNETNYGTITTMMLFSNYKACTLNYLTLLY